MSLHVLVPRIVRRNGEEQVVHTRITVLETRTGGQLILDLDDDGIGTKKVTLAISELTALADQLNRIRRKVVTRKEWRP